MRGIRKIRRSRSKQRYKEYIDTEYSGSYADFLGIEVPVIKYKNLGWEGLRRMESSRAIGEWKKTNKEAKASYKEKLTAGRGVR
jgi:hypothetical protein